MSLPESYALRRRKRNIQEIIQDIDAFNKTSDEVLEEKRVSGGIISGICFSLIFIVLFGQFYDYYFDIGSFDYKFAIDVAFKSHPEIDLDMVIASPCSSIIITRSSSSSSQLDLTHILKRNATRFEFTERERYYWEELKAAHRKIQDDGKKYIGLDKLNFISGSIQRGLEAEADLKQLEEAKSLRIESKGDDRRNFEGAGAVLFIIDGMSVLQVVANGMSSKDSGACRIHGRFPIDKTKGDGIIISFSGDIAFGGLFAHLDGFESGTNTSHRIERLNFGPRIHGLMTPLAGTEQISLSGMEEYHYFLNIVPTRIFHNGILGGSTLSYQYSVTFMKKVPVKSAHLHPSIHIHYDFAAMVIEVRKINKSLFNLFLHLFAAIGGIYGTCSLLNVLMRYTLRKYWPELQNVRSLNKGLPADKQYQKHLVFNM